MKKEEFRKQLHAETPEPPDHFELAMQRELSRISAEAQAEAPVRTQPGRIRGGLPRKAILIAMIVAMLAGAVALASTLLKQNVFELILWDSPENADSVIQYDLAKESFDECDVEIKQAAYDGVSLYIVYSIRERGATETLGEYEEETGLYYYGGQTFPAMERDQIGWWTDQFWIDGRDVDMPSMSTGMIVGSDTPGELLFYNMYRLDQEDIYLDGKNVEIALPIGRQQPHDTLVIDRSGDKPVTLKPGKGLITFHLDCSVRDGITITHPNVEADLGTHTAKVAEVTYSPIQMYATMSLQVKQEALDAFTAQYGEGWYDSEGNLMWPYSGMDVFGDWIATLQLVDGDGVPVFDPADLAGVYGLGGYGDNAAWFTFPYLETWPDEMYLAPMDGDTADFTQAVRLK